MYIPLRVRSSYSLGTSTNRIPDIINHCKAHKIPAVCLADKNMFGCMEFAQACQKAAIQAIHGCLLLVESGGVSGEFFTIAANNTGFLNLLHLASIQHVEYNSGPIPINVALQHLDGVIVLCGGHENILNQIHIANNKASKKLEDNESKIESLLLKIQKRAHELYIEIIRDKTEAQKRAEVFFHKLAQQNNIPCVATTQGLFQSPEYFNAQDVLICIVEGHHISEEARPCANKEHYMRSYKQMQELFADIPQALANTCIVAQKCLVFAKEHPPMLPKFSKEIPEEKLLQEKAFDGLKARKYPKELEEEYKKRLEYELGIINKMKYAGYFLIVSDFIQWSKSQKIPVGPGRGSGAGSLVAWTLQITDVDPIKFGLFFERFLNPERVSLPDFDIDFCQYQREKVIQYVRKKYGEKHVSNIITFRTMQARAVVRDVGRALQMPYGEIDAICKMIPNNPANPVTLEQAIALDSNLQSMRKTSSAISNLLDICLQLEGVHTYASTHAAGILISEKPLEEVVPLYKDSNGLIISQYTFKYAEIAGLVKFDFLGLKNLTLISFIENLITKRHGAIKPIDLQHYKDEATYKMLATGQTHGIFQFESAGMKQAIRQIKPDCIEDLIALGSLYRPGPMENIPNYVARKHGNEAIESIHPKLDKILEETYGIIVYQEQVIQIAQELAGYTLGSADLLRRAMGKKIKAEMEAQRNVFLEGAQKKGVTKEKAQEVFMLIEKFASYGFNKSHAAAYAVISFLTAFFKTHYPLEFFVSSMNLELDDTDKLSLFIQDAKTLGIEFEPICINKSNALFSINKHKICFGMCAIKQVSNAAVEKIVEIRKKDGPFSSMEDFLKRCPECINKRSLESMIKAGVFTSIHKNKKQLLESVEKLLKFVKEGPSNQLSLFEEEQILQLDDVVAFTDIENSLAEFQGLGYYFATHPLSKYQNKFTDIVESTHLDNLENNAKVRVAAALVSKKIRSTSRGRYAFLQASDCSGIAELCIFNEDLLLENNELLDFGNLLIFSVIVRKDNGGSRFVVDAIYTIEDELKILEKRTSYNITVSSVGALNYIKQNLRTEGCPVELTLQLEDNTKISIDLAEAAYIETQAASSLSEIDGVEVKELIA